MKKFMNLAAAMAIVIGVSSSVSAGTISIVADVVAAFENDGAFTPVGTLPDITMNQSETYVYQVDFSVLAETAAGERNFGNILFNLGFNGVAPDASIGWLASSETVDTSPAPGIQPGPIFGTNVDGGAPGDFQSIIVSLTNGLTASDQRSQAVNGVTPTLMGSVYVTWDGTTPATITWADLSGSFVLDSGLFGPEQSFAGGSIAFGGGTGGDGPDLGPGGALDFGYNGQSQIITLTNVGDETANFLGDQFEITGDDAGLFSLVNPNFNPIGAGENRQFEVLFNSGSNAQASYSAALTFLTDAGVDPSFTLTAQVPEPSTVALAGLGVVGLVGLARRRK